MTDTIEIEVLPFAEVVVLLTNMSPPPVPQTDRPGHGTGGDELVRALAS